MYKVLLVDDEILIREKMAQKIPWQELGFELVAACENGQQAIEVLEKEYVDVVLTDICMPYVDGIELAKYIFEKEEGTKVLILSGYAEFEYAKQAVRYQVYSYLLKPITSDEMVQVMEDVRKSLELEQEDKKIQNLYQDNYSLLRAQRLMRIAQGDIVAEQVYEMLGEYDPSFYKQGEVYCAALLCSGIRLPDSQADELEKRISELSSKLLIFRNQDKGFVLFGREKDDNSLRCLMTDAAAFVNRYIQEQYKTEIAFLIGTNVTDCAGIHFSYEKALELKEFLYLQRENHLYVWDDYYKSRQEISLLSYENDYEKNVLIAVQSNLTGEIKECVYAVIEDARREWYQKPRVISIYQRMLLFVIDAFQKIGIGDNVLFDKAQQAVEGLYRSTCITEMVQITLEFLLFAAEIRNADRESYGERQAALAVEYIDRHFDDCDLTMTALCKKLAISVSYFSTAFKDYTGKTFVEVLTDRRLKEAKMLLSTSELKTYEIAERCGYRDSSYFSALFKRNTCMTPKEYTKENRK